MRRRIDRETRQKSGVGGYRGFGKKRHDPCQRNIEQTCPSGTGVWTPGIARAVADRHRVRA